jgi:hypothetical protein
MNHFSYSALSFHNFVSHFSHSKFSLFCYSELSYFMILSVILEILSVIFATVLIYFMTLSLCQPFSRYYQSFWYSGHPFCKIPRSFSRFCQPFFRMTTVGSQAKGGSRLGQEALGGCTACVRAPWGARLGRAGVSGHVRAGWLGRLD